MSTAFDWAVDTFVRDLIWRGKYGVRGAKSSKPSLSGSSDDNVASVRVLKRNRHNMLQKENLTAYVASHLRR